MILKYMHVYGMYKFKQFTLNINEYCVLIVYLLHGIYMLYNCTY